ncbi:MAG TPA: DUF2092 domain-containing protein [Candidatus Binataceae bacterium]|nr:DUF2092 domain-containing protein [Candidatus Binataceae bacterium]
MMTNSFSFALVSMMLAALITIDSKALAADGVIAPSNQATVDAPASATSKGPPSALQPQTASSHVDPEAEKILRGACSTLAEAKSFTLHAEIAFDQVLLPTRLKLQFAAAADYAVKKPNQLALDYASDLGTKSLWYNGTNQKASG